MRFFATAQECCDTLVANGWVVCIASTKPEQTGTPGAADKQAIVVAMPFPSQPFVQAAQQEMEADVAQPGKLRNSFLAGCSLVCRHKDQWKTLRFVLRVTEHCQAPTAGHSAISSVLMTVWHCR